MSTKHSKAAEKFLQDSKMAAWHNETLWMVRAKRDKMSKEVPEWEELRNKACELKLYSNSHLEELLQEFEKNATANGAIVHWAKDADEYCAIVYEILNEHNVHHFIKSKSMLAEECGLNPFLMERGIDVVESDLGERILQLMHLEPSHIVLPAIHIKREQVGELFEKEMGTEKGNFDPTYLTHAARKNLRHLFLNAEAAMTGANFAVASTGDIVVCTNEGNADMGTSYPKLNIAAFGVEKIFAISGTIFTVSLLSMVIFPSELSPTFSTFTVSGTDTVVLHPARETTIIIAKPAAANVLFFILDSSLSLNGMVSHSKTCLQICVFPALTVNHTKTRLLY